MFYVLTQIANIGTRTEYAGVWSAIAAAAVASILLAGTIIAWVVRFRASLRSDYFTVCLRKEEDFIHIVVHAKRKEDLFGIKMQSIEGALNDQGNFPGADYDLPWSRDPSRTERLWPIQRGAKEAANLVRIGDDKRVDDKHPKPPDFLGYSTSSTQLTKGTFEVLPLPWWFAERQAEYREERRIICKIVAYGRETGAICVVVRLGYLKDGTVDLNDWEITQRRSPRWRAHHDFDEIG